MAKADLVFLENLDILTEEGTWDENPRPKYRDGESAHSRFITDVYVKYKADITPIISLRHTAWKTGIKEIIAIYQKQVNTIAISIHALTRSATIAFRIQLHTYHISIHALTRSATVTLTN